MEETIPIWNHPSLNSASVFPTTGQQKQVDPEVFRFFYTIWKETEAEAQDVDLPVAVLEHLEANERVYKLSSSVKTSHGVGKIAMTQRRLFLLTEGRPGYVEVTKFRDIEVRPSSPMHTIPYIKEALFM